MRSRGSFRNEYGMYDLLEIVGELSCVLLFYVTDTVNYYYYFVIVVVDWQFIININLSEQK